MDSEKAYLRVLSRFAFTIIIGFGLMSSSGLDLIPYVVGSLLVGLALGVGSYVVPLIRARQGNVQTHRERQAESRALSNFLDTAPDESEE